MTSKLFSENLGSIRSDEELALLKQQFPDYDLSYICQAAAVGRKKIRTWMEKLWQQYEPYADSHFLEEIKRQFGQRAWELYLGTTFLNRGFALGAHQNTGPDFDLRNKVDGKRLAWVEAIAVQKGVGNDRVPDLFYGGVMSVPEEEMTLRLTNALSEKFKRYEKGLQEKIIKHGEPYVIAMDRSELQHVDASMPLILKALFGIGDLTIVFELGQERHEPKDSFHADLPSLDKKNGKPVPMKFFLDPKHAGVSAVIYSMDNILNSPRVPGEMGENFIVVHNPNATNSLPQHFFPFGMEFVWEGNAANVIREKKRIPPPRHI